jgi:hypothetical protein
MNRIILIGNGFDLAHGLETSYKHFIDSLWENEKKILEAPINGDKDYRFIYGDNILIYKTNYDKNTLQEQMEKSEYYGYNFFKTKSSGLKEISFGNRDYSIDVYYKNDFLVKLSDNALTNWVDIEDFYYQCLIKEYKNIKNVTKLNREFSEVKSLFIEYLPYHERSITRKPDLAERYIFEPLIAEDFINPINISQDIGKIIFINFNYTQTLNHYNYGRKIPIEIIHIHGEILNSRNPIIFGYGNEHEDNYNLLEKENKKELLDNIKSFWYSKNDNYKNIIRHINSSEYQIYIFGLSCGQSDGTLLNRLFEHENCKSIKIFYYNNPAGTNNYIDTYINMSRHFKNKEKMREIIVSEEKSFAYC